MDQGSSKSADPVQAARAEIDRIDDSMLELVAKRLAVADKLALAKTDQPLPMRPAREVQMLRRLVEAAADKVDGDLVIELWRSLISANVRRQRPIDVVVGVGGGQDPLRHFDLARRHFGARTRIHRADDARAALNRVAEQEDMVAVVPWPNKTGAGMWWHILTESRYHKLLIIAALPIRGAATDEPEAAVVAQGVSLQPAGGDFTLGIAFDRHYKAPRALAETGIKGAEIARADTRVFVRLDEFMAPDDPRTGLLIRAGLDQFRVVGSFARV